MFIGQVINLRKERTEKFRFRTDFQDQVIGGWSIICVGSETMRIVVMATCGGFHDFGLASTVTVLYQWISENHLGKRALVGQPNTFSLDQYPVTVQPPTSSGHLPERVTIDDDFEFVKNKVFNVLIAIFFKFPSGSFLKILWMHGFF